MRSKILVVLFTVGLICFGAFSGYSQVPSGDWIRVQSDDGEFWTLSKYAAKVGKGDE